MSLITYFRRDDAVEKVRPIRNQLCDLFDVPKPVMTKVKYFFLSIGKK